MLLAVEGGGFFSSSASGYSKGLALLLLGQKNEDRPMRVTPWNQYQLVDQETDPDIQLASGKNCLVRGCASFVCFSRTTAGLDSSSPLKVGPTQQREVLPEVPLSESEKEISCSAELAGDENGINKITKKSSLKKPKNNIPVSCGSNKEHEVSCKKGSEVGSPTERRKVQWMDTSGGELVEIREFELSDDGGSDDEFNNGAEKSCSCTIM